jgi:hypothetical protein
LIVSGMSTFFLPRKAMAYIVSAAPNSGWDANQHQFKQQHPANVESAPSSLLPLTEQISNDIHVEDIFVQSIVTGPSGMVRKLISTIIWSVLRISSW